MAFDEQSASRLARTSHGDTSPLAADELLLHSMPHHLRTTPSMHGSSSHFTYLVDALRGCHEGVFVRYELRTAVAPLLPAV